MTRSWFGHVTRNTSIQTSDYRWKQNRIARLHTGEAQYFAEVYHLQETYETLSAPAFRFVSPPVAKACR
jgi:hypothetical protein